MNQNLPPGLEVIGKRVIAPDHGKRHESVL